MYNICSRLRTTSLVRVGTVTYFDVNWSCCCIRSVACKFELFIWSLLLLHTTSSSGMAARKTYSVQLQQKDCRWQGMGMAENGKTYCCEIKFITQSFLHVVQGIHKTRCLTLLNPSLASEAAFVLCCVPSVREWRVRFWRMKRCRGGNKATTLHNGKPFDADGWNTNNGRVEGFEEAATPPEAGPGGSPSWFCSFRMRKRVLYGVCLLPGCISILRNTRLPG